MKTMPELVAREKSKYPGVEAVVASLVRAAKAAQVGLAGAKVERNGNEIAAAAVVKTDQPVTDAVLLFSLVPRAPKEPDDKP